MPLLVEALSPQKKLFHGIWLAPPRPPSLPPELALNFAYDTVSGMLVVGLEAWLVDCTYAVNKGNR